MRNQMRRKPGVYLLVISPILFFGGFGLIAALIIAYAQVHDVPRSDVPDLNGILVSLPAFFMWIPLSLLLGNIVLRAIAPLRRTAERYIAEEGRPGFVESQRMFLKVIAVMAIVCIPLIILGFLV